MNIPYVGGCCLLHCVFHPLGILGIYISWLLFGVTVLVGVEHTVALETRPPSFNASRAPEVGATI